MELAFTLGVAGWIIAIAGAVVFGVIMQLIGEPASDSEWLLDGVAAFVGAIVASEFIVALQAFGPVVDGLALVPALAGGLIVGGVVTLLARYAGGTFGHSSASA